jgi:hypothetical protein
MGLKQPDSASAQKRIAGCMTIFFTAISFFVVFLRIKKRRRD